MNISTSASPVLAYDGAVHLPSTETFVVRDAAKLGRAYGDFTVTYVGPNFLRLFGDTVVAAQPPRRVRTLVLQEWTDDQALASVAGRRAGLADLFAALTVGPAGPCRFRGESNTVYQHANGGLWTPHFYTRGNRLGFGALPFGDAVGWEPGDVFLSAVPE